MEYSKQTIGKVIKTIMFYGIGIFFVAVTASVIISTLMYFLSQ